MPGGGRLTISLNRAGPAKAKGKKQQGKLGQVQISVTDEGTGMDDQTLSRIFEPFFTTKEQGKGTGLGLPMVYGLVQESNGTIDVESAPGEGSTFTVLLPEVEGVASLTASKEELVEVTAKGETILLAEDDIALRRLAQTTLEELGYQVLAASDGFEAIELEGDHEGPIHLLLSDVVMPGLGGFELTEAVRQTRPDVHVLLMSGYPSRGQGEMKRVPEGVDILQKPVDQQVLAKMVRRTLDTGEVAA
jgi:CheY-like chemotaxis protein